MAASPSYTASAPPSLYTAHAPHAAGQPPPPAMSNPPFNPLGPGPPGGQPMMAQPPPAAAAPPPPPASQAAANGNVSVAEVWIMDTRIAKLGALDHPIGGNQAFYGLCRVAQAVAGQSLRIQDFRTSETRCPKACPIAAGPFHVRGLSHSDTQAAAVYNMFQDAKLQPDRVPQDPYGGKVGDMHVHYVMPATTFLGKKWDANYLPNLRQQLWTPEATVYASDLLVTVPRKHEDLAVCIHRVPFIAGRTDEQMWEEEKERHAKVCLGKPYAAGARPAPDNVDLLWEQVGHDQAQYRRADIPEQVWYTRHPEWSRIRPPIVLSMAQAARLASDEAKNYKLLEAQKLDPTLQRQWGTVLHSRVQKLYEQYKANGWSVGGFAFRNEWTLQELIKISVAPPAVRPAYEAQLDGCFSPEAQRLGLLLRNCMDLICNQAKRGKGRQGGLIIKVVNEQVKKAIDMLAWPTVQASRQDGGKWLFIDEDPSIEHNAWAFLARLATLVGTVAEAFIQSPEPKTDAASFNGLVQLCQFHVSVGKDDTIPVVGLKGMVSHNFMQSLEARLGPPSAAAPQ